MPGPRSGGAGRRSTGRARRPARLRAARSEGRLPDRAAGAPARSLRRRPAREGRPPGPGPEQWRALEPALPRRPGARLQPPGNARPLPDPHRRRHVAAVPRSRHVMFQPRIADAVAFFQAQRDGANVIRRRAPPPAVAPQRRSADVYAHPPTTGRTATSSSASRSPASAARSTSRAAGSTPATSSSSPTPRRTPTTLLCVGAARARLAGPPTLDAEARFGLRLARQGVGPRTTGRSTSRSASARATRPARSTATTTCGGCPRTTTRSTRARNRYLRHRPVVPGQRTRARRCRRTSPAGWPPRSRSPPRSMPPRPRAGAPRARDRGRDLRRGQDDERHGGATS